INKLVQMNNPAQIKIAYDNIKNEYINPSISNTTIQNILNTTMQNNIIDNKIENKTENKIDNIYKNILQEIKVNRPYNQLTIIDKKVVLEKINKMVQMKNPSQIKTAYEKIKNEYIQSSLRYEESEKTISKKVILEKFHQDKLVSFEYDHTLGVIPSSNKNIVLTKNSRINETNESSKMVYIGNPEALIKHEKSKIEAHNESIDLEIKHKKFEIVNNIQNMYENLDENLDELALKIFNDLKDEINIEYKRIY
ncbi:MAG: hypothetical protein HRT43_09820, partial [Campylobacteraceae bacterium]|nr:hypothetical protein [Campylobacteraceae bacterium]